MDISQASLSNFLIERIRERCKDLANSNEGEDFNGLAKIFPVASPSDILELERDLGFDIPHFYATLLTEVGNGGFGPGYGLAGTKVGAKSEDYYIAELYHYFREKPDDDPGWSWPEKLIPAAHLGCGMYWCIDCRDEKGRVIWFEPNPREVDMPLSEFLMPLTDSIEEWFQGWLNDIDFMEPAYEKYFPKHYFE
ncbi:SMI1/KNR4 family protein [Pleionea sp. CnH1-48]|uniref:SMI1/KNR4 family protein n=1 Tax=Pleionea sp. CnH1-48 TaxID=2954494 RepID=UPI0020982900|nr:SMI1/KNR4 family protein [Pleionea sp. CnH1-48]